VSAAKVAVLKELELVTLTPAIRVDRGIRSPKGALIYNLSDRVSDELGLAKGDLIVQINRVRSRRRTTPRAHSMRPQGARPFTCSSSEGVVSIPPIS
jgi:hypothetical protein